jgi:PTH2 family peptidyl-tRNA hydrolase
MTKVPIDDKNKDLIQYYVINTELLMSKGKVNAQVAHASMLATLHYQNQPSFIIWQNDKMKKVMLEGMTKDLIGLRSLGFITVVDLGLNEIEPNSLTVVVLPIMTREEAHKFVKRLQLYH